MTTTRTEWGVRSQTVRNGPLDRDMAEASREEAVEWRDNLLSQGMKAELIWRTIPEWTSADA